MIKTSTRPDRRREAKANAKRLDRQQAREDEIVRRHKTANRVGQRLNAAPFKPTRKLIVLHPGAVDFRPDEYLHSHARQMRALARAVAA